MMMEDDVIWSGNAGVDKRYEKSMNLGALGIMEDWDSNLGAIEL